MIDADTLDRCDNNEDAYEVIKKHYAKNLLGLAAMVRALSGDEYGEDSDESLWEDEIYND